MMPQLTGALAARITIDDSSWESVCCFAKAFHHTQKLLLRLEKREPREGAE
jgi:hypothetical protein